MTGGPSTTVTGNVPTATACVAGLTAVQTTWLTPSGNSAPERGLAVDRQRRARRRGGARGVVEQRAGRAGGLDGEPARKLQRRRARARAPDTDRQHGRRTALDPAAARRRIDHLSERQLVPARRDVGERDLPVAAHRRRAWSRRAARRECSRRRRGARTPAPGDSAQPDAPSTSPATPVQRAGADRQAERRRRQRHARCGSSAWRRCWRTRDSGRRSRLASRSRAAAAPGRNTRDACPAAAPGWSPGTRTIRRAAASGPPSPAPGSTRAPGAPAPRRRPGGRSCSPNTGWSRARGAGRDVHGAAIDRRARTRKLDGGRTDADADEGRLAAGGAPVLRQRQLVPARDWDRPACRRSASRCPRSSRPRPPATNAR